jgi:hypothetical protein
LKITFKNFIEQHPDTLQCNMRYNIKYKTENDELNRNSSKNTFYILYKKKLYIEDSYNNCDIFFINLEILVIS